MPSTAQRDASRLFSTALFRPLLAGRSTAQADLLAAGLRASLGLGDDVDNFAVVRAAYDVLCCTYRSEYFYKNLITSNVFVGRHRATNAILLNEFRIGESIADCVLINGRATVYEIKTEFDSPDKLESQLKSYYRGFPYVNIVAHVSQLNRYKDALQDSPAGLIVVGSRGRMSSVKLAEAEFGYLSIRSMFNSLRLNEVTKLLTRRFGRVPDVPNGLRYASFLELACKIPSEEFQREMQLALKGRGLKNSRDLLLNVRLLPLRTLLAKFDPNERERRNLLAWLQSRAS